LAQLKGQERSKYVTRMFDRISTRYDSLNTIMTLGRHHSWKKKAVNHAVGNLTGVALDVAAGTGDISFELCKKQEVSSVVAADFSREMLNVGVVKASNNSLENKFYPVVSDAHSLPFNTDSFICATIGFGVRNFVDLPRALAEIKRVVKPGGKVVVLEIVKPRGKIMSRFFPLYFCNVTPILGAMFAGEKAAYSYLPESVQGFMTSVELSSQMEVCGLEDVYVSQFAFGSMAIVSGTVPDITMGQFSLSG